MRKSQTHILKIILGPLLLLTLMGGSFGDDKVEVRSRIDKARAPSDETILFTLKVDYPKGVQINIPDVGPNIEGFQIEDFGSKGPELLDGKMVEERWFRLEANISGTYVLPEVTVQYKLPDGSVKEKKVSEIFVEITPPGEHSDPNALNLQIKDITPVEDHRWIWASGIGIGVLILGVGSFLLFRGLKKKKKLVPPVPVHIWSLEQLERVKNGFDREGDNIRPLYFELSDILRVYFEKTFSFPATDRTIEEIQTSLASISNLDDKKRRQFLTILEMSDLVKFANAKPDKEAGQELVSQSVQFIKETMPQIQNEKQEQQESFL